MVAVSLKKKSLWPHLINIIFSSCYNPRLLTYKIISFCFISLPLSFSFFGLFSSVFFSERINLASFFTGFEFGFGSGVPKYFIFYKNGLPYLPNLRRANELYQEKRTQNIRNRLKGHDKDLPVPTGTYKSLATYYPAQNDLPATYKVGQRTVRKSASNLRKAQSRQLKAFLLFFEQILANYLSQLDHFKELFSWEQTGVKSYFTQHLQEISGIEELYVDFMNLSSSLEDIIETEEVAQERKNRFLDHLLGRFSEDLTERSEEHTSELQSPCNLVCRLLLEKKNYLGLADTMRWLLPNDLPLLVRLNPRH